MRTLLISLSRPSNLINHDKKRMKLEATHLAEAQQCEIIAKLSKPNASSKWALGREYEVTEGAIQKVMETMQI